MSDFMVKNHRAWKAAIRTAFGSTPPTSATWLDIDSMAHVLQPFMGDSLVYAMLPGSGGLEVESIAHGREDGCLRLNTGDRSFYVAKPKALSFEYIDRSPENSFLLMELSTLTPSGVYEVVRSESEQVVEVDEEYRDYAVWHEGILGHDYEGNEITLPDDASIVVRLLRGKILFVAKASFWNLSDDDKSDGRHDNMSAAEIREVIERSRD